MNGCFTFKIYWSQALQVALPLRYPNKQINWNFPHAVLLALIGKEGDDLSLFQELSLR